MRCSSELLSAYLDDQLPRHVRDRVRAHLARCAACRRELAGMQAVKQLLARAPAPPPPAGLAETIVGHVRFREAQRVRRRPRVRFWQGAVAGGAVAAVVIAGWLAGSGWVARVAVRDAAAPTAVEEALYEHSWYASLLETGAGDWMDWALVASGEFR